VCSLFFSPFVCTLIVFLATSSTLEISGLTSGDYPCLKQHQIPVSLFTSNHQDTSKHPDDSEDNADEPEDEENSDDTDAADTEDEEDQEGADDTDNAPDDADDAGDSSDNAGDSSDDAGDSSDDAGDASDDAVNTEDPRRKRLRDSKPFIICVGFKLIFSIATGSLRSRKRRKIL
jgi:hypothetical protein